MVSKQPRGEKEIQDSKKIGIGLVGYGYWGPNLARNFNGHPDSRLIAICDEKQDRAAQAADTHPGVRVTGDFSELLSDSEIQVVVIATPVSSHFPLARGALLAGKDVLIEKPLTKTRAEAEELIKISEDKGLILAVDHTFIYTGAVIKMKEIVGSGELGDIIYIDSVRVNLGLFQQDVNVIYDLAPHDLSIAGHLLERDPVSVSAFGSRHSGTGQEYLSYIHLEYDSKAVAHFHLNWLSPVKVRRMLIGGTKKMIVYDDMEPSEKVKLYDKGIEISREDIDSLYKVRVEYRTGDMMAPKTSQKEALRTEADHFLSCIKNRTRPITDANAGLAVVKIIEAAQTSIRNEGAKVDLNSA